MQNIGTQYPLPSVDTWQSNGNNNQSKEYSSQLQQDKLGKAQVYPYSITQISNKNETTESDSRSEIYERIVIPVKVKRNPMQTPDQNTVADYDSEASEKTNLSKKAKGKPLMTPGMKALLSKPSEQQPSTLHSADRQFRSEYTTGDSRIAVLEPEIIPVRLPRANMATPDLEALFNKLDRQNPSPSHNTDGQFKTLDHQHSSATPSAGLPVKKQSNEPLPTPRITSRTCNIL